MMVVETGIEQYERESKGIKVDVEVTSNDIIEVAPAVAPTETPIIETVKDVIEVAPIAIKKTTRKTVKK